MPRHFWLRSIKTSSAARRCNGRRHLGHAAGRAGHAIRPERRGARLSPRASDSQEAHRGPGAGLLSALLHRSSKLAGLAFWVGRSQHGIRDEATIAGIVGSVEYFSRLQAPPPDTQPPVIVITSPISGLTTSQNIDIVGREPTLAQA